MSLIHLQGLKPIISELLTKILLRPTNSPYNTPILPVKKPNGSYWLVQDHHLINAAVTPIYPEVPNTYTLLSLIPCTTTHFTVLDLKDAFFTIPVHLHSQNLFAFTWTDSDTHTSQQLTWTVLPQGFRNSPHLFGQAVARDFLTLHLSPSKLLQCVDDLLLCSPSLEDSQQHTALLLNFLGKKGYHVSPNKAQLSLTQVTYLGLSISPTHKTITLDHKALLASLPAPTTKVEILSFLSLAGYLRAWVPNFSLVAKPLYEAPRGPIQEPLDPSRPVSGHLKNLLQALLQAPALRLLDLTRPFFLYVSERQGFALGVLGHNIGPSFAPVAYLSKQLDPTTRGWAPCLRALTATSFLFQESKKLTFGSPLTVYSPHRLSELLT
jgi:hypothetical protein